MRKSFLFVLVVVSMLASLALSASAPMPAPATAKITGVTLVEATFMKEKGMIFKFKVTGTFDEKELKGFLAVKDKNIKLRCRYHPGNDVVQCTAPGGTATNFAGKSAVVTLNGFGFWVQVPAKNACRDCD
ncbi:MAG: hypothetical protein RBS68_04155 [Anaerolineales bacterium]|jgi:hypothetical protein|nr:hypothetical protein [Anaerolineales bacterium]